MEAVSDATARDPRHEPAPDRSSAEVTQGTAGLWGRERESASLAQAIEAAARGRRRFVMILGEAGAGKTRLMEEAERAARKAGFSTYWGHAHHGDGVPSYWPWIQILRSLCSSSGSADVPQRSVDAESLDGLLGELASGIGRSPQPTAVAREESLRACFHLMDGIVEVLFRTASHTPTLLLLDDLQWADPQSLVLLQMLVDARSTAPLIVVAGCREPLGREPNHASSILNELLGRADTIRLRPLDERSVTAWGRSMLGAEVGDETLHRVWLTTEGNPFFVLEVLRILAARPDGSDIDTQLMRVPQGLRYAAFRHVDALPEQARSLVRAAAIVGREFKDAVICRVADMPSDEALVLLDRCEDAGVLTPTGIVGVRRFRHAIIRDALYDDIPTSERTRLHLRVAESLEEEGACDDVVVVALAHHYLEAAPVGGASRAISYALRAGQRCLEVFAYEDAIRQFESGLRAALWEDAPNERQRDLLLLALGDAQRGAGDIPASRSTFMRVVDRSRRRNDAVCFGKAVLGATGFWTKTIKPRSENVRLLEEALELDSSAGAPMRAWILVRLASELAFGGRRHYERRVELVEEAIDIARSSADPALLNYAMNARRLMPSELGSTELAIDRTDRAERLDEGADDVLPTLDGLGWGVAGMLERGELGKLDATIRSYLDHGHRARNLECLRNAKTWEAMRANMIGDQERAEKLAWEGYELAERLRFPDARLYLLVILALIRSQQGRIREIETDLRALAVSYREFPIVPYWMLWLECELGNTEAARKALKRLSENGFTDLPRDYTWHLAACMSAGAAVLLEDREAGERLYDLLLPYADRNVVAGNALALQDVVSRVLGRLAFATERLDAAESHLSASIEKLVSLGAEPLLAQARFDLAEVRLARFGSADRAAHELLDLAGETVHKLGMLGLSARISALKLTTTSRRCARSSQAVPRTTAILRNEGEFWTVEFEETSVTVKDNKGLRYIETLLRSPEREFHVMDLIDGHSEADTARGSTSPARSEGSIALGLGDAGEMIDVDARRAYRRRLEEIRTELDEVEALGQAERAEQLRGEMEFLARELANALGMGGRHRRAASSNERARISVKHAISRAIGRLESLLPSLGRYLQTTIRTGTFCCYRSDPRFRVDWIFEDAISVAERLTTGAIGGAAGGMTEGA